jgi:hypothetical protein
LHRPAVKSWWAVEIRPEVEIGRQAARGGRPLIDLRAGGSRRRALGELEGSGGAQPAASILTKYRGFGGELKTSGGAQPAGARATSARKDGGGGGARVGAPATELGRGEEERAAGGGQTVLGVQAGTEAPAWSRHAYGHFGTGCGGRPQGIGGRRLGLVGPAFDRWSKSGQRGVKEWREGSKKE